MCKNKTFLSNLSHAVAVKMSHSNFGIFLLAAFVLFSSVQIGSTLKCYNCTELSTKDCKDPFKSTLFVVCSDKENVCVKHKLPPIDLTGFSGSAVISTNLIRGCKPKNYCTSVKNFTDYCSTCSSDYCNSSTVTTPSVILIAVIMFKNYFV